jgi:hypothetical protein
MRFLTKEQEKSKNSLTNPESSVMSSTVKEDILTLKPDSIYEVVPEQFFFELNTHHDEYLKSGNYYEHYYAISKFYQPSSILEIGVRFGYSLGTMIKASEKIKKVIGIDCDDYVANSLAVAEKNIKKFIQNGICFDFRNINSHSISKIEEYVDLIHIDGDHSYEGKIQDLNLVKNNGRILIVDDYISFSQVQQAANDWMRDNKNIIKNQFVIESIRGTLVIELNTDN